MTADARKLADEIEQGIRRGIRPEETALIVKALRGYVGDEPTTPTAIQKRIQHLQGEIYRLTQKFLGDPMRRRGLVYMRTA